MQIEKCGVTAYLIYFVLLLILVITSMWGNIDIVNIVYLVVILSCVLKFILIVNENKK